MSQALKRATESSLIIIDEFGKGTEMVSKMACCVDKNGKTCMEMTECANKKPF